MDGFVKAENKEKKNRPIEADIRMLAIGLFKYAKCANVSNKKFTNCENMVVSTPSSNALLLRILFGIKTNELATIPKIPPKDQYEKYDLITPSQFTECRKKSYQEKVPPSEIQIKA